MKTREAKGLPTMLRKTSQTEDSDWFITNSPVCQDEDRQRDILQIIQSDRNQSLFFHIENVFCVNHGQWFIL